MNDSSIKKRVGPAALRWILRGLLLVWAAFWAWFVVMVSLGEAPAPPAWIPVAWLAALGVLVWLAWRWPILGGLVLVGAGAWAGVVFANSGARALLAAPAVGLGLAHLLLGRGASRAASLALLLVAVTLCSSCLAAQDPADLPFRTSSILRHADGRLKRGWLVEPTELQGFPCQGWTWWHEDGRLESFDLSRAFAVQGHDFPAATRLFFDAEGRLAHAWLSEDTVIDGRPCRGRWKIDTAFHPNGRVLAFFPREPYEIDGVLCVASVFHPIYLHPDGRLRQCKLAREVVLDGRTFRKGARLELDATGVPR